MVAISALGHHIGELCEAYKRCGVQGVGITGGEPFLDPARVLNWLSILRRELPSIYLWAYTNGLLLSHDLLNALADAGLNELRFNLAATGYSHPHVRKMLGEAIRCLSSVAVEIPAIPEHETALLAALPEWSNAGVRYLNLHDLVYEPGTSSEHMPGARAACMMPDGHPCAFHPQSETLVIKVLSEVSNRGIPLAVNYCSLRNKARQIRGRRRMMAAYTLQPYERLLDNGQAESLCVFDSERMEFIHPSSREARQMDRERRAVLLRRQLPLSPDGTGQWVYFESLFQSMDAP